MGRYAANQIVWLGWGQSGKRELFVLLKKSNKEEREEDEEVLHMLVCW